LSRRYAWREGDSGNGKLGGERRGREEKEREEEAG
jgi:hypothetical protein